MPSLHARKDTRLAVAAAAVLALSSLAACASGDDPGVLFGEGESTGDAAPDGGFPGFASPADAASSGDDGGSFGGSSGSDSGSESGDPYGSSSGSSSGYGSSSGSSSGYGSSSSGSSSGYGSSSSGSTSGSSSGGVTCPAPVCTLASDGSTCGCAGTDAKGNAILLGCIGIGACGCYDSQNTLEGTIFYGAGACNSDAIATQLFNTYCCGQ